MTDHTPRYNLPYPEGRDAVAVHTDVEALAMKADTELHHVQIVAEQVAHSAAEAVAPPRVPTNLIDLSTLISGALDPIGDVIDHPTNMTTGFIPVSPDTPYVSLHPEAQHRVVWFDANQRFIAGTDTDNMPTGEMATWVSPADAAYARIGFSVHQTTSLDGVVFNQGTSLVDVNDPTNYPPSGYWDGRERPRLRSREVTVNNLSFAQNGRIAHEHVDGAVPPRVANLYDPAFDVPGNLGPDGNIFERDYNLVTGWIPVQPNAPYVTYTPVRGHRVVFFDENRNNISGTDTDWQDGATVISWHTPNNAAYMRVGLSMIEGMTTDGVIINYGTQLWSPDKTVSSGWWDDRELPPGVGGNEHELTQLVERLLPQYEPSFPTLQFETIYEGWTEPYWLSEDGEMLYGRYGFELVQSADEWETHQTIHTFPQSVQAVRTLGNGELIVSTNRNESEGVKAKLYRSYGYTRQDPTAAEWIEVVEAGGSLARINNSWGLMVYENVVVASEYGLRGEEGARLVWLSEDYGATFTEVFDQKTVEADGRPPWNENGHVHTVAWDPYWSRIWVVVGDNPNTATYYSDDKGDTWTFVEGSGGPAPAVQYTGIMPLPDVVVFGSDRAPNGIHVYRRGEKSDMPVIRPLLRIDDSDTLTRVFQLAYKRDWQPTTPTYFAATPAGTQAPSVIVGTVDGKKAHLLWEGEHPASGLPLSGGVRYALGPTAQGNIIAQMIDDPTVTGTRVMKAPSPSWARA